MFIILPVLLVQIYNRLRNVLILILVQRFLHMFPNHRHFLPEKEVGGWFPRICAMETVEQSQKKIA